MAAPRLCREISADNPIGRSNAGSKVLAALDPASDQPARSGDCFENRASLLVGQPENSGCGSRQFRQRRETGVAEKFQREHCEIISVDPCEPLENYSELLGLAKGDFIFCMSDDDQCIDRAILPCRR